ncbi:MAG TPA: hypothetical protein VFE62_27570 [Gemmataceae bacterium]|nr:hypothetical protein [Gemmataceae bacterium]
MAIVSVGSPGGLNLAWIIFRAGVARAAGNGKNDRIQPAFGTMPGKLKCSVDLMHPVISEREFSDILALITLKPDNHVSILFAPG